MIKKLVALLVVLMVIGQAFARSEDSEEASHNGLGSWLFGYGVGRMRGSWGRPWGGWGYGGYGGYGGGWGMGWKHNAQESESADE